MSSLIDKLDYAIDQLGKASSFAKARHQNQVLEISSRVLAHEGGIQAIYTRITKLVDAGLFLGTDWDTPQNLVPHLVPSTLQQAAKSTVVLDCISQLRMLSLVERDRQNPNFNAEQAKLFLAKVLCLNLNLIMGNIDEALRTRLGSSLSGAISQLYQFLLQHLGYETILVQLVDEVWRILAQRPIQVNPVKAMITQIAVVASQEDVNLGDAKLGIDRLVSALYGPTQGCYEDPGIDAYVNRLSSMDNAALQQEAGGFSRAMHDVGLVSDYHAVFIRWLLENDQEGLLPLALGLSSTGIDVLSTYNQLVYTLIIEAVHPATAQSVYGLAMLLENGTLFAAPIAPSLWRQINLQIHPEIELLLQTGCGAQLPARVQLLAGVISLLGQPLGVSQGNNPTCQSARAISLWAVNDPDYLLNAIVQVARHNNLRMHFEGKPIDSNTLLHGLASTLPLDTDPVSMILVPHLDKLYMEMGKLCADRGEDPHKWINPEFHGWYVGREFMIAVDIHSAGLKNYDQFIERFYRSFHPLYNGNIPVIHPQPVGIAITNSLANFVGWHAVTLIRVALDQDNVMRVYFYNPNNDSGQNWGAGIHVSTQGKGERFGEASLPFDQFLSRIYIYHDDPVDRNDLSTPLPQQELALVKQMALNSWAKNRVAIEKAAG